MHCVRQSHGILALALGLLLPGCGESARLPELSTKELAAPPGPDSGEPFLSSFEGTVYLSWLERMEATHELRMARFGGGAGNGNWDAPIVIHASDRFMVSWADFPSLSVDEDGSLWAHWLVRGLGSGYGVHVARSADRGASWSEPWSLHEDTSATEHGFVASVPWGGGRAFAWLDGRAFAAASSERAETALYFRPMAAQGPGGPEAAIDTRVCDCCQTDAATTDAGPVLVYRDRSEEEIRDVHIVRWQDGAWTDPRSVHVDGWETGACPVNGPAVDARGLDVAVAWFTAAEGVPLVKVAFSDDAAERFGEPVVVDDGDPAGRVDVVLLEDGSALVSWIERTEGDRADVRVRYVSADGRFTPSLSVSASSSERASGFARMTRAGGENGDRVVIAWTDVTGIQPRVRVAAIDVDSTGESR